MLKENVLVREWEFQSCEFRDRTVFGIDQIKGVLMAVGREVSPEVNLKRLGKVDCRQLSQNDISGYCFQ